MGEQAVLAELMEMSSESDGRPRFGKVSGVRGRGATGRPGRQLGGSAHSESVITVGIICRSRGFTSGWHPRRKTCPSLSRGVAWTWKEAENKVVRAFNAQAQQCQGGPVWSTRRALHGITHFSFPELALVMECISVCLLR